MVVLKKIKASTLMETLVATILIVVIFMISSMILNNLFSNTIKNNTSAIDNHLNELQYLFKRHKLAVPYQEDFNNWQISTITDKRNDSAIIVFEAINRDSHKSLTKTVYARQE